MWEGWRQEEGQGTVGSSGRMMNEDGGAITGEDGGRSRGAGNRRKEVAESNEKG